MASTLQQFAKKRKKEQTTVITARIPNSNYKLFKKYCDDLGLSINEAINILISNELKELTDENGENAEEDEENKNQITIDDVIENAIEDEEKVNTNSIDDEEEKVNAKENIKPTTNKNTKSNTKRFILTDFKTNDEIPCPMCKTWQKASNFSRHAKKHMTTTKDMFTNDKYKDTIKEMIEAKKAEQQ